MPVSQIARFALFNVVHVMFHQIIVYLAKELIEKIIVKTDLACK